MLGEKREKFFRIFNIDEDSKPDSTLWVMCLFGFIYAALKFLYSMLVLEQKNENSLCLCLGPFFLKKKCSFGASKKPLLQTDCLRTVGFEAAKGFDFPLQHQALNCPSGLQSDVSTQAIEYL